MAKKLEPVPLLPFRLHNLDDFLIDSHPIIDPYLDEEDYKDYWYKHIKNCLQGVWGLDKNKETDEGGFRWMPGNLFFYVNDTVIKMEGEESREVVKRPLLRDIEWYLFYALTVCDGFSGFEKDEQYTCYRPLGILQGKVKDHNGKTVSELTPAEEQEIVKLDTILRKPNGEYKEYIKPIDLLYRTYDEPKGKPYFHNELQNIIILATRGLGKSYAIAGGVITYDFVFGSARTLEEYLNRDHPSTIVVGSALSTKSDELLNKFSPMYEYMRENVGGFSLSNSEDLLMYDVEEDINSPMYQPYTGSLKVGKVLTNRVLDEGGKTWSGTDNKIVHITFKDNASAGVGYRARRMVIEEAGLLSNFTDVHNENEGSQKRGKKSGYTVYIGTGGDIEKIKGIREAFYKPDGFKCYGMNDKFSMKPTKIGLFIPSYYADNRFKDELGNTDYERAFKQQIAERDAAKKAGSKRLAGQIISYPILPSEMFLQSHVNIFPSDLIERRLTDLETGLWEKIAKTGELEFINKEKTKVQWYPKALSQCKVIKRWGDEKDFTDSELKGQIVVYEHPTDDRPKLNHYNYRYLVAYDSVRDEDGGTSIASVLVFKFWDSVDYDSVQFNIVAEWFGRHIGERGLEKDHDVAFKLSAYYDAPLFPEINLKDVLRYGRISNRWHFFLPRPGLALDAMEIKQKNDYKVGVRISPGMKPDLEKYLNDVFHTVVDYEHSIIGSEEIYNETKMIQKIPSMRLCEEALYYTRDGNFDGISAAMLIGVANRQRLSEPERKEQLEEERRKSEELLEFFSGDSDNTTSSNPAFDF